MGRCKKKNCFINRMEYYPLTQQFGYSGSYYQKHIYPKIKGVGHSFKNNNFHKRRWWSVSEYLWVLAAEMQARLNIWKEYDLSNDPGIEDLEQRKDFFKKVYAERISKISKKKRHLIKLKL